MFGENEGESMVEIVCIYKKHRNPKLGIQLDRVILGENCEDDNKKKHERQYSSLAIGRRGQMQEYLFSTFYLFR